MVKKSHGVRHGTRSLFRKRARDKGKLSVTRMLQVFNEGEKVKIIPEPAVTKGMPFRRFAGKIGTVDEKRGRAYVVSLKDGNITKRLICLPVHLKKV